MLTVRLPGRTPTARMFPLFMCVFSLDSGVEPHVQGSLPKLAGSWAERNKKLRHQNCQPCLLYGRETVSPRRTIDSRKESNIGVGGPAAAAVWRIVKNHKPDFYD